MVVISKSDSGQQLSGTFAFDSLSWVVSGSGIALLQGDNHGNIILCNRTFHVLKVNTALHSLGGFQSEGNVGCGNFFAVGEVSILPDGKGPDKAIVRQFIAGCQIVLKGQFRGSLRFSVVWEKF